MTLYNVHIFREMRLFYPGIEANSPEAAARIAAERQSSEAQRVYDCDGKSLSAVVDRPDVPDADGVDVTLNAMSGPTAASEDA